MTEWHEREIFMKTLHEKNNLLKWWQPSTYSFPAFSYLARKVLSTYIEQLFPEAGNLCEKARNRLLPNNIKERALIIIYLCLIIAIDLKKKKTFLDFLNSH